MHNFILTPNDSKTNGAEEIKCLGIVGELNKVNYEYQEYV